MTRIGVSTLACAGSFVAAGACSHATHVSGPAVSIDASDDWSSRGSVDDAAASTVAPTSSIVPSGWRSYAGLKSCPGLYLPQTPASLPAPIAWRDCDAIAPVQGPGCRQMVEDWPPDQWATGISSWVRGYVRSDGSVVMQVSRFEGKTIYRMIAEVDGPVDQTILEDTTAGCTLGQSDLTDGEYVYTAYSTSGQGAPAVGAIAGTISDSQPHMVLDVSSSGQDHSFVVGTPGVLDENSAQQLLMYSWDSGTARLVWSTADDGLFQNYPFLRAQALFWQADAIGISKVKDYTPDAGVQDLVSFEAGVPRGVANLGTDGQELVWLEGDGLDAGAQYDTVSIMTSPFTTDPATVVPRRLRSESPSFFGAASPFRVGCGYAARYTQFGGTWGEIVVRISDGHSWFLTTPAGSHWSWANPIALTCTELFSVVALQGATRTVARVRFDALGPGMPPD
jgi:hypothetical protein